MGTHPLKEERVASIHPNRASALHDVSDLKDGNDRRARILAHTGIYSDRKRRAGWVRKRVS